MIVGRTERLVLEPLSMRHADGLFAALRHDAVDRFLSAPDAPSLAAVRERIARLARGAAPDGEVWLNFVVKREDAIVGRVEATNYRTWAEIAYLIGPEFQFQGFGREAVRWLVERLHEAGCQDVWGCVHRNNARSIALLDKLGFVEQRQSRRRLSSFDDGDLMFEHATTRI